MFAEVLPNVMPPILVEATIRLGYAIFAVATLTFIGFGLQPPSPDWAVQIADNYAYLAFEWWTAFPPCARDRVAHRRREPRLGQHPASARAMTDHAFVVDELDVAYRVRGRDRPGSRRVVRDCADIVRPRRRVGVREVDRRRSRSSATSRATGAHRRVDHGRAGSTPRPARPAASEVPRRRCRWSTRTLARH